MPPANEMMSNCREQDGTSGIIVVITNTVVISSETERVNKMDINT